MKHQRIDRRLVTALATAALVAGWGATASAQLDPLLFVKRVSPTVVVAFDTSFSMLEDGTGTFYDTNTYSVAADAGASAAFGLDTLLQTTYRRKYVGLQYEAVQDASKKWETADIIAIPNTAAEYATFWDTTRYEIARKGLAQAVAENVGTMYRWSLVKHRQDDPVWKQSPSCDKPVRVTANATLMAASDTSPCNAGGASKYGIYAPEVDNPNYSLEDPTTAFRMKVGLDTNANLAAKLAVGLPSLNEWLIPASRGERGLKDRPISHLLDDAKAEASRAMGADAAATRTCRNTIVVLITGGADSGSLAYTGSHNAVTSASAFSSVSGGGVTRSVPIYVIAVKPVAADEAQLQQIASTTGGQYFRVTRASEVTRAVNLAVQAGFTRATEFTQRQTSEFVGVSPILGTVNLENAVSATGGPLVNTLITMTDQNNNEVKIPQRSNVMITAGFALPGFAGRIRAFRTFVPQSDETKPSGYKFVADGTVLWPDLDGRPELAGLARVPADPVRRNIYTAIPGAAGPADVIAFTSANAALLAPHMNQTQANAAATIDAVRALPLGAVIGSTPALMDAPSLDPPPDEDYGRADDSSSFAATFKNRRSILFFGANDGMIHAIDGRTGYEVWAFIPYNLLPKVPTLLDGQPMEQFDYFVDSSPKVAEVKANMPDGSHQWRSMLIIGEGPGGTFYQAFDVTEAGMGVAQDADGASAVDAMLAQFDSPNERIVFKWAFPNYSSFDPTYVATHNVTDATPGGRLKFFGDLKATASPVERTVGFTWSDPAVGPLDQDRTINVVMVGSGYFPALETVLPGRKDSPERAGRSFYLLKVEDGTLLGNPLSCSTAASGTGCLDVGDVIVGSTMKNGIQADPSAAGDYGSHIVRRAYAGDLDGKYWRFNFDSTGALSKTLMVDAAQPIFSSSALLFVGSTNVFMFFSTGSDLLPVSSLQGTGKFKLWALQDISAGSITKFTRELAQVTNTSGLATGERPSTAPSVAGDIVFFTTTTEDGAAPCSSEFTGNLYAFTYLGGAAYDSAASGNNKLDTNESPLVRSLAGRATSPFIVDQHLYFSTSKASVPGVPGEPPVSLEAFGDPEDFNNGVGQVGVRVLSWREIR